MALSFCTIRVFQLFSPLSYICNNNWFETHQSKDLITSLFKQNSQTFSFRRFFEFHMFSLFPVSDCNNYLAGITNYLFESLNHFCLRSCVINLSPQS
ncbi:hypothetical protein P9112_002364 [Eukaryota sp. TZLM1-RC]